MKYRELGRTGYKVSEISFGAWAIGGTWGPVGGDPGACAPADHVRVLERRRGVPCQHLDAVRPHGRAATAS